MSQVTLAKSKVVAALTAAGWPTSGKWQDKKLATKVLEVAGIIDDPATIEDEAVRAVVVEILGAIDGVTDAASITIEADATPEVASTEATTEDKKDKTPKAPKAAGVPAPKRNRQWAAGQVLKEIGMEAPHTDEVIAKVDALMDKSNLKESKAWLSITWHAVNGYLETAAVPGLGEAEAKREAVKARAAEKAAAEKAAAEKAAAEKAAAEKAASA